MVGAPGFTSLAWWVLAPVVSSSREGETLQSLLEHHFPVQSAALTTVEHHLEEGAGRQLRPLIFGKVRSEGLAVITPLFQVRTIVHGTWCRLR